LLRGGRTFTALLRLRVKEGDDAFPAPIVLFIAKWHY
jgi:hypothetical protein